MRVILAAAAVPFLLSGCGSRIPTYRYRMTVEVNTPEGVREGSTVIEVKTSKGPGFPGPEAAQISTEARGEAVAVDLGKRGFLFAVLNAPFDHPDAGGFAWALLPNLPNKGSGIEAIRARYDALKNVRGSVELQPNSYPLLVTFGDLRRPDTVAEVDPQNLESTFGTGVHLQSIRVEITDDAPVKKIKDLLPWWREYLDKHFDGSSTVMEEASKKDIAAHLSAGSFSSELQK
jgi:hypothetical protein